MPLRKLTQSLNCNSASQTALYAAAITKLLILTPILLLVSNLVMRGLVLLHPSSTYAAEPSVYRVMLDKSWTAEHVAGSAEVGLAIVLVLLMLLASRAEDDRKRTIWLRTSQALYAVIAVHSCGLMYLFFCSNPIVPAWTQFFTRFLCSSLGVLLYSAELKYYGEKCERRAIPDRRARNLIDPKEVEQMSDEKLGNIWQTISPTAHKLIAR